MSQRGAGGNSAESYDDWPHKVAESGNWRVIECRNGIQWILQKARKRRGGREWQGQGYFRIREALIRSSLPLGPQGIEILKALPPFFPTTSRPAAQKGQTHHG